MERLTVVAYLDDRRATSTPTPLPLNWVTPVVVTATPTPANQATADRHLVLAYLADATGTPTPTPPNLRSATPSPTYFILTSVPTPENGYTAMAYPNATATMASTVGTATPLPANWVTPVVITATPTPWMDVDAVIYPTPTFTPTVSPTPDPNIMPDFLVGRIGFISDRDGGEPWYYVMDGDGGNVQRLTGPDAYEVALVGDTLDPTGQYQVFVSQPRSVESDPRVGDNYELSLRRLSDGYEWYIAGIRSQGRRLQPGLLPGRSAVHCVHVAGDGRRRHLRG